MYGQALGRVRRVQRHVGAARLEHAQHGHHHLHAALQADAHAHLGADAPPAQVVREPVGARGPAPRSIASRRGRRPPPGRVCARPAPRTARARTPAAPGRAPRGRRRAAAPARRPRAATPPTGASPGRPRERIQHRRQVPGHARDGRRLEERGAVHERPAQLLPGVGEHQVQVELGDASRRRRTARRQSPSSRPPAVRRRPGPG